MNNTEILSKRTRQPVKNCKCCNASFNGVEWCELPVETKLVGLCDFCNPKDAVWFIVDGMPNCKYNHSAK